MAWRLGIPAASLVKRPTLAAVADEAGQIKLDELDAEAAARRRTALAQIRQYPDPVLRLPAREVESFDHDLRRLLERMKRLMADAQGVGLAGTQVGVLQRVAILQATSEDEPVAVVNPRIVERSEEVSTDEEGCLSLQGVLVPVERHCSVTLEAQDGDGEPVRLELTGIGSRVAQHELDHLDGVLILERTTPEHRSEALGILRPRPLVVVQ
jgi:peptide deformylase